MKIKVMLLVMLVAFVQPINAEISPKDKYTLLCITEKSSGLILQNNNWIHDNSNSINKYIIKKVASKIKATDLILDVEKALGAMSNNQLLQYGGYLKEDKSQPNKEIQASNLNSKMPVNCKNEWASPFSEGCFTIKRFGETDYRDQAHLCEEDWSYTSLKSTLNEVICKNHSDNWIFHPNGQFHKSTLSTIVDWPYKKVSVEIGRCSTL